VEVGVIFVAAASAFEVEYSSMISGQLSKVALIRRRGSAPPTLVIAALPTTRSPAAMSAE